MAQKRQITANKQKAQKSTTPKTEAGKAKFCLYHLSHGFASSAAQLTNGTPPGNLMALLADLTSELLTRDPTGQILVERMCQNQWLRERAFRFQADALWEDALRGKRLRNRRDLELLIRNDSTAERNSHKAHAELVRAQKERQKSEIGFES